MIHGQNSGEKPSRDSIRSQADLPDSGFEAEAYVRLCRQYVQLSRHIVANIKFNGRALDNSCGLWGARQES